MWSRIAREYTAQRFPGDAITLAEGADLPGFDGALYRAPAGKSGWGIVYNNALASPGRINFTLAHEFGHYLLHRADHPNGIRCSEQDVVRWDSAYGQIEHQANLFAATLLMPLDDFRRQIDAARAGRSRHDLALRGPLSRVADRRDPALADLHRAPRSPGGVARRIHPLVARQRSGGKTGAVFRTSGGPIEIPPQSLPRRRISSSTAVPAFSTGPACGSARRCAR